MHEKMISCELCQTTSETVLGRSELCRVVLVEDADYPGFCRVIWNRHVKEMTDLEKSETKSNRIDSAIGCQNRPTADRR